MRVLRSVALVVGAVCISCCGVGCRVQEDARAASQQMTATAVELERYYGALVAAQTETVSLLEIDGAMTGVPFSEEDRKKPEATRDELLQRKEIADALSKLALSMAALTDSTAASDVQTSATALGNALVNAKALPDGSPIPESLGKVGRLLIQIVQQHEEKKAAQAMDETLAALTELFAKEQPAYDSIARFHLKEAAAVARDLNTANALDVTPMLAPALKPFDLVPVPASPKLQASLRQVALRRLDARADEKSKLEMEASAAMLQALKDMNTRVHTLATGHHMDTRGNPFTLQTVEEWVNGLS